MLAAAAPELASAAGQYPEDELACQIARGSRLCAGEAVAERLEAIVWSLFWCHWWRPRCHYSLWAAITATTTSRRLACSRCSASVASQRLKQRLIWMSTGFELLSTPDSEASRNSSHGETRVVLSAACLAVVRLWRWGSIKNFKFLYQ